MRREEAEGVVAPVVAQAALDQVGVVHELVHRHQLDRGHPEALQVFHDRRVGDAGVGATKSVGDVGVKLGEALDVRLVDQALVVRDVQRAVTGPVEERVHHHAEHHPGRGVLVVAGALVAEVVAEEGLVPLDGAVGGLGVRVQQQLVRVAAHAGVRVERAVHPVAVPLARIHLGQVGVPDVGVHLGQLNPRLVAIRVEQAQLDALCHLAEQGEVRAPPVVGRTERVGRSWPDLHPVLLLCWNARVSTPLTGGATGGER